MKFTVLLFLYITDAEGQLLNLQGISPSVVLGDSFQFTCTITGGGAPRGLLYFKRGATLTVCTVTSEDCSQLNNSPGYYCGCVNGQTHIFHTNITSVRKEDNDDSWVCQYSVSTSAPIKLAVLYAPTITAVPSSINVTENTSPNIDCSSSITPGNPSSTSYKWIGPGGYSNAGSVLERIFTRTQRGQYTCTANNTERLSDTSQVYITVLYPPTITSIPSNFSVPENIGINLNCSRNVILGYPTSTSYRWTGPGGYSKTGTVLDRTVTRSEGGQYTCTATNTAGLLHMAVVNVNIQYLNPPAMSISPTRVSENGSVQVFCNVTSEPTVQMTIRNLDNNTNLVEQETTNSHRYIIEKAQCLHNGTFQCLADNEAIHQTMTSSQSLNIPCSPRHDFRKTLKSNVSRAINETVTMNVDVIANPFPNFTWWRFVDDQLEAISENTVHTVHNTDLKSSLQIRLTHVIDYGMYAVHVENEIGECILYFRLSQITSPWAPDEVTIVSIGSTKVTIQWKSNFNGGYEQTFSVEYRTDETEWSMWRSGIEDPGRGEVLTSELNGLMQNSKYLVQVYAQNRYGLSKKVSREATTTDTNIDNSDRFGLGLAIGFGIMILVVIVLVIFLIKFYQQGKAKSADTNYDRINNTRELTIYDKIREADLPVVGNNTGDSMSSYGSQIELQVVDLPSDSNSNLRGTLNLGTNMRDSRNSYESPVKLQAADQILASSSNVIGTQDPDDSPSRKPGNNEEKDITPGTDTDTAKSDKNEGNYITPFTDIEIIHRPVTEYPKQDDKNEEIKTQNASVSSHIDVEKLVLQQEDSNIDGSMGQSEL